MMAIALLYMLTDGAPLDVSEFLCVSEDRTRRPRQIRVARPVPRRQAPRSSKFARGNK